MPHARRELHFVPITLRPVLLFEKGLTVTQTAALYHLQTLDSAIDAIRARLDEIERLLGEDEALRSAQEAVRAASESLQAWKTRQTDLELERGRLKEEADAIEERLYSGRVTNPRELTDMQGKLTELRRRYEQLEEPILEAMLAIEEDTVRLSEAQAALQRISAQRASLTGELIAEQANLQARLESLLAQAAEARRAVDAANLRLYDSLRRRPGGVAVAAIGAGGECSICGVQITSSLRQQVRRGEVLTCPTCGRILYA